MLRAVVWDILASGEEAGGLEDLMIADVLKGDGSVLQHGPPRSSYAQPFARLNVGLNNSSADPQQFLQLTVVPLSTRMRPIAAAVLLIARRLKGDFRRSLSHGVDA